MTRTEPRFVRPDTVAAALAALTEPGAMILAGGTSMVMMLKNRLIEPETLVYLADLPVLSGVSQCPDGELRIGATTTMRDLAGSSLAQQTVPSLTYAVRQIGNPRVRAVATVGGGLTHADPRQDMPPVLLALDASARLSSANGERSVRLAEFFHSFLETAVDDDELITEVVIPSGRRRHAVYLRYTPASEEDYPTVGVAACIEVDDDGTVRNARVALGGVADIPILVAEANDLLAGRRPDVRDIASVAAAAEAAARPFDDQRGSVAYKKAMAAVWTQRAVSACFTQARRHASGAR